MEIQEIKPVSRFSLGLKELWQYRGLFFFFAWRDVKVKYKQTVLGFLWAILQPFILMVVFSFFFGKSLNVPSDNIPYPIFVYSGLLIWGIFSSGLTSSSNSMVSNANIIKKIYFPRLILPFSAVIVSLFDFLMAFLIYVGFIFYFQFKINMEFIILLPIALIMTSLSTVGIGTFISALNVKYRDFRYIIPFLVQLLFFLTPIIYPVSLFKDNIWIQRILGSNPIAISIDLLRSAISGNTIQYDSILIGSVIALSLFIGGIYFFKKTEYYFADLA